MAEQIWKPDEINERLILLSRQILPEGLTLYYAEVDDIDEQEVNPRSMPQKMFNQLVDNVKGVGALESVPLCVRVGKRIQMVSGHHRLRAARAAGIKYILILLYEELSVSRIKSKQLAHNTITGQDDPELVKRVWDEITDIQAQFEAYVDPRVLNTVPEPVSFKQVDVDMGTLSKTILVIFLASQKIDFDLAVNRILPKAELDEVYLAQREVYDGWREALQRVRSDLDIVSIPTALAQMARLACERLDELAEEEEEHD
jgi:hypothetical protein